MCFFRQIFWNCASSFLPSTTVHRVGMVDVWFAVYGTLPICWFNKTAGWGTQSGAKAVCCLSGRDSNVLHTQTHTHLPPFLHYLRMLLLDLSLCAGVPLWWLGDGETTIVCFLFDFVKYFSKGIFDPGRRCCVCVCAGGGCDCARICMVGFTLQVCSR